MFATTPLPENVVAVTLPGRNFATHCFTDIGKTYPAPFNTSQTCRSNEFTKHVITKHGATLKEQVRNLAENFEDVQVGTIIETFKRKECAGGDQESSQLS